MGYYEAYKGWVRENNASLSLFETGLSSLTWLLPDRFNDSELGLEALHTGINLLSSFHEGLLADPSEAPAGPGARCAAALTFLQQVQVLAEVSAVWAERRGGPDRHSALTALEGAKAALRLAILQKTGARILLGGGQGSIARAGDAPGAGPVWRRGRDARAADVFRAFAHFRARHCWPAEAPGRGRIGERAAGGGRGARRPSPSSPAPSPASADASPVSPGGVEPSAPSPPPVGDDSTDIQAAQEEAWRQACATSAEGGGRGTGEVPGAAATEDGRAMEAEWGRGTGPPSEAAPAVEGSGAVLVAEGAVPAPPTPGKPPPPPPSSVVVASASAVLADAPLWWEVPASRRGALRVPADPAKQRRRCERQLRRTEAAAARRAAATVRLLLWGELLHVLRPVVHAAALRKWGRRSWKPWLASLGTDLVSDLTTGAGEIAARRAASRALEDAARSGADGLVALHDARALGLNQAGRDEVARRRSALLWYLLRDPVFGRFTRPALSKAKGAISFVPGLDWGSDKLLELLTGIQQYYTYTNAN